MTLNSSAPDRSALSVFERSETPQTCCETTWYIEARRLRGEGTVAKGVNAESESRAEWFASAVRACKRSYVLSCSLTMRMHSQHAHRFGQAGPRVEVHRFHRSPVGRITDSVACSITFTSCAVSCIGMWQSPIEVLGRGSWAIGSTSSIRWDMAPISVENAFFWWCPNWEIDVIKRMDTRLREKIRGK